MKQESNKDGKYYKNLRSMLDQNKQQIKMSIVSRSRSVKRPNPNYGKQMMPGLYRHPIAQHGIQIVTTRPELTKGAFGKSKLSRR